MDAFPSRLLTTAEAAEVMGVSERAVREWVADGLIAFESAADGEPRIRVAYENHVVDPGLDRGLVILDLHPGESDERRARFRDELAARRRENDLGGLEWTGLDVDTLTTLLAARLTEVVPDRQQVSAEHGMVHVAGSGVDVALFAADGNGTVEERLIYAAGQMLERASEALAEITSEPWPATAGQFPSGLPPHGAKIAGGELRMWYGREDDPILELAPIRLDAVTDTGSPA